MHIPSQEDYEAGRVDRLGFPAEASIGEVVKADSQALAVGAEIKSGLANHCIWQWAYLQDEEEIYRIGSDSDKVQLRAEWMQARAEVAMMPPLLADQGAFRQDESLFDRLYADTVVADLRKALVGGYGNCEFGFIKTESLINPLQILDLEFAAYIASSIPADLSQESSVSFALPLEVSVDLKTLSDEKSATVITRHQQVRSAGVRFAQVPEGVEVTFLVSPIPQSLIVTENNGRYYLRAGMHRAFVLMQRQQREIPCLLVHEGRPPRVSGPYPSFPQTVLEEARPPLLVDAADTKLTKLLPMAQRTQVLRMSVEDFTLPVD